MCNINEIYNLFNLNKPEIEKKKSSYKRYADLTKTEYQTSSQVYGYRNYKLIWGLKAFNCKMYSPLD